MGSKAKAPAPVKQTALAGDPAAAAQAPAPPPPPPDPEPTNISSDIAGQQARDIKKNRKGRSWSMLSRAGSDSRRTVLNGGNATLGG